jgi:hypothetical protein
MRSATHTVCKQKINRKMCRVKHIKDKESYLYPVLPANENGKYYAMKRPLGR